MPTAEELIVSLRAEGAGETKQQLEGVEQQVADSADEMGNQADQMEGFSQKFRGAMGAAVAGLSIAAAGLLSQVPVIGEAMSGLFSIVEAVAFQMDKVLRPILSPVADLFYDVSAAIFEADGAMGTVIGVIGTLISLFLTVVVPVAMLIAKFTAFSGTLAVLKAGALAVVSAIGTLVGALSLPIVAVGLVIAAVALLAWHFREEIVGAIKTAIGWIKDFANDPVGWIEGMVDKTIEVLGGWADDAIQKAKDIYQGVKGWLTDLAAGAVEWGKNLIDRLIEGIKSKLGDLKDIVGNAEIAGGVTVGDISSEITGAFSGGGGGGGSNPRNVNAGGGFRAGRSSPTEVYLDGKRVTESTGRWRQDETSRRGI